MSRLGLGVIGGVVGWLCEFIWMWQRGWIRLERVWWLPWSRWRIESCRVFVRRCGGVGQASVSRVDWYGLVAWVGWMVSRRGCRLLGCADNSGNMSHSCKWDTSIQSHNWTRFEFSINKSCQDDSDGSYSGLGGHAFFDTSCRTNNKEPHSRWWDQRSRR